ncbi:general secretion pathway protein GspM [Vibrio tubiashii]|nr:general secretion pathway protein GspM [Vibrio tubiashii]
MNKLINTLQVWWSSISVREQRLVSICAALVIIGGLYWGVVQPVVERADQAQARIQTEKQLLTWVKSKADDIRQYQGQGGRTVSSLPINQAVSSSVSRFQVELIRVQPRGEEFQVWVAPLPFNQFVSWITYLQETHGINVIFLDIDKGSRDGIVEVKRLQLGRG